MSQPERLGLILDRAGSSLLSHVRRARSVSTMTTDNYEVMRRVALLIEDEADHGAEHPKEEAKSYVRGVLDNGWVSSMDDVPVWELVAELGHDRDDMDSLAVYHQIAGLIDSCDLFNG